MEMDKVMKLRELLNKSSEDKDKLSVNDFIVKASALALEAIPRGQQLVDERFYQPVPHLGHLRCYLDPHWIDHPHWAPLGMYSIKHFTVIISASQSYILAVGATGVHLCNLVIKQSRDGLPLLFYKIKMYFA
ncbi:pyruvate dehydrogenase complex dihydrolipoamide acetyltransferase component (E2) [Mortierella sp. GBA39]|nr:pyruvate dehydrogenase complex dihydrolipoamide acetyltransferase component (E2) [Mortierella sp. GBA39]